MEKPESPSPATTEAAPAKPVAAAPSRASRFFQRLLRWTLILLVTFALGGLVIFMALYNPARQSLTTTGSDLESASQRVNELETQVETLTSQNETLSTQLNAAATQNTILRALSAVRAASVAIMENNPAGARLAVTTATQELTTLADLLPIEQADLASELLQSITTAATSLPNDLASAQVVLDNLAENLVNLDATLSKAP